MPSPPKNKPYFLYGLIAITLLFCLYYVYFLYHASHDMPLKARHAVKFLSVLIAYGIGVYTLKKFAAGWMIQIWHAVYLSILALLVLLGLYDWIIARAPIGIRSMADTLQEFLISPILYVAIGIINRSLAKQE